MLVEFFWFGFYGLAYAVRLVASFNCRVRRLNGNEETRAQRDSTIQRLRNTCTTVHRTQELAANKPFAIEFRVVGSDRPRQRLPLSLDHVEPS